MHYSTFLVPSRGFGEVISVMAVLLPSISAAHSAAPTVFVKVKKMLANGMSSSRVATVPKAVYGAVFSFNQASFCGFDHFFSWK